MGTRLVKELKEFAGELSLEGLHFWKTAFSAMTHYAAAAPSSPSPPAGGGARAQAATDPPSTGDKQVVLLPCKTAPSRQRVHLWLEARKQYEALQKGLRHAELLKKDGVDVRGNAESAAPGGCSISDLCGNPGLRTPTKRKRNPSLASSPAKNAGSRGDATEMSPMSDEASIPLEEVDERTEDEQASSPESSELPSWQPPSGGFAPKGRSEKVPEAPSPGLSSERASGHRSPPGWDKDQVIQRDHLQSTPLVKGHLRSPEHLEPACSTPISKGKEPFWVSFLSSPG